MNDGSRNKPLPSNANGVNPQLSTEQYVPHPTSDGPYQQYQYPESQVLSPHGAAERPSMSQSSSLLIGPDSQFLESRTSVVPNPYQYVGPTQPMHQIVQMQEGSAETIGHYTQSPAANISGNDIVSFSQQQYNYPPAQSLAGPMGATLFRYKTFRTIPLTKWGNFVVDVPVPDQVARSAQFSGEEFSFLRYTAVVGDPDEFYQRGFYLRPAMMDRSTELFIVITMYNEDEVLFLKTWRSIRRNINHLCNKRNSPVWGPDGWKKIVVCIVSDGRTKINPKTLAVIGAHGVYQDGLMKTVINNEDVSAHLFEYTTSVALDEDMNVKRKSNSFPVQVLFCLKEKNAKKINSHRWFFNAFGRILNPKICVLLDVGTKPTDSSIYHLWKEFEMYPNVAGACGEIYTEQGKFSSKLFNPLVAAQNFEYKMSNILDKPFESVFGFISVLPGAFSAYRYQALLNRSPGDGPLDKYFIGEKMHDSANLRVANMYLAEDRILCFELVTKRKEAWVLRYVKRAKAETDVPDTVPEFISQRRRWLNGSFFAGLHAIMNFYQIFRSGHSLPRKFALLLQNLYNIINLIFNWFSIGNFYLAFYFLGSGITMTAATDPFFGAGNIVFLATKVVYFISVIMIFVASLGNRPQASKWLYTIVMILFALIMGMMLYMSTYTIYLAGTYVVEQISKQHNEGGDTYSTVKMLGGLLLQPGFRDLALSLITTYGTYLILSIAYMSPWHMLTSFLQYLFMTPSFINVLMVYSFCNLHDVSWGTKGDTGQAQPRVSVHTNKTDSGERVVTVDLPVNQDEINEAYEKLLIQIRAKDDEDKDAKKEKAKLSQEDYFKSFRTQVVIFWVLSNIVLIFLLTTDSVAQRIGIDASDPTKFNPYLSFILWFFAALSVIRAIGAILYLCIQNKK